MPVGELSSDLAYLLALAIASNSIKLVQHLTTSTFQNGGLSWAYINEWHQFSGVLSMYLTTVISLAFALRYHGQR